MRLFLLTLCLVALPSLARAQDCGSTCLDVCQHAGDEYVSGCACSFGCGCICASFNTGLTCEDFGCQTNENLACAGRPGPSTLPWLQARALIARRRVLQRWALVRVWGMG